VRDGDLNRRITAYTPFKLTGPAAGSDLVKTEPTPPACGCTGRSATAPADHALGHHLVGEENVTNYFLADPTKPENARYGLQARSTPYNWEKVDPRFDATDPAYANEPNRFRLHHRDRSGEPRSVPRKHTAMGRFKHEGANIRVDKDGTVVAYMGDDERLTTCTSSSPSTSSARASRPPPGDTIKSC
jgi:secreted PhoX family phosphatase